MGVSTGNTVFIYDNDPLSLTATLSVDNYYGLYYGNADGTQLTLIGSDANPSSFSWTTPETWTTKMPAGSYLYVLAWDIGGPQAFIGQFNTERGTITSNTTDWVAKTGGINPGLSGALPSMSSVQAQIGAGGWNNLLASADNGCPNGSFPWGNLSNTSPNAQYIWSDTTDSNNGSKTTTDGNYVLFRTRNPIM